MSPSEDDRRKPHPRLLAADVQGTDAFGTVHLVRTHGEQINVHALDIKRNLAIRLSRIRVEQHPVFAGDASDFLQRIDGADLVVPAHQRNEDRVRTNRLLQLLQTDATVLINIEESDLVALLFQVVIGVNHCLVFNGAGDDVASLVLVEIRNAKDSDVIRFRSSTREDNLLAARANQATEHVPCASNSFFSSPAKGMVAAGSVTIDFREIRQHRLHHPWVSRRSSVVVKIDG